MAFLWSRPRALYTLIAMDQNEDSDSLPLDARRAETDVSEQGPPSGASSSINGSADVDDRRASSDVVVELRGVHKTYLLGVEGVPALRGVSVSIRRGEFVVILGKSGGGKTSLLNCIGTIDKPTRGDIFVCGTRIDSRTSDAELAEIRLRCDSPTAAALVRVLPAPSLRRRKRRKLGFVFQQFNLLPGLTALENVELPMVLAGTGTRAWRRRRALDLLSQVGIAERVHHVPSQLSGGEQQRVTIARCGVRARGAEEWLGWRVLESLKHGHRFSPHARQGTRKRARRPAPGRSHGGPR